MKTNQHEQCHLKIFLIAWNNNWRKPSKVLHATMLCEEVGPSMLMPNPEDGQGPSSGSSSWSAAVDEEEGGAEVDAAAIASQIIKIKKYSKERPQ